MTGLARTLAAAVLFVLGTLHAGAQAWPDRLGEALHVFDEPQQGWTGFRLPEGATLTPGPDILAMSRPVLDAARGGIGSDEQEVVLEGGRSYIVVPTPAQPGQPGDGGRYTVYISADRTPDGRLRLSRTWFRFLSQRTERSRGLAVLMPGMYGTPEDVVQAAEDRLRRAGWAVLRMLAPPARTTERRVFALGEHADEGALAAAVAAELDDRAAEAAYAVRAATADTLEHAPELADLARVAIGMSGSAITLPTVVALEPDGYAAAVIIAGGSNAAAIARESSYRDWIDSIHIEIPSDRSSPDLLSRFDAAYLAASSLDAHHTAEFLASKPVLLIHGSADRAVPAERGDSLWRSLDEPERWVVPVDHELLFGSVLLRMGQIVGWLNDNTARPHAPGPAP